MAYCMSNTIVKYDGELLTAHPLRCRCWSCEYCRPWRKAQLVAEAKAGKPQSFITLTSNPHSGDTPSDRAMALVDAWRHIVRELRRMERFKRLQYIVVMERTERGEPHLHILARMPYLSQKWLSEQMRKLTGAPIVDIRRVKSADAAARYVAKYVGKNPYIFQGCKRYWKSLDYKHPTRRELREQRSPDTEFFLVSMRFEDYRKVLESSDVVITETRYNAVSAHTLPNMRSPPKCSSRKW